MNVDKIYTIKSKPNQQRCFTNGIREVFNNQLDLYLYERYIADETEDDCKSKEYWHGYLHALKMAKDTLEKAMASHSNALSEMLIEMEELLLEETEEE